VVLVWARRGVRHSQRGGSPRTLVLVLLAVSVIANSLHNGLGGPAAGPAARLHDGWQSDQEPLPDQSAVHRSTAAPVPRPAGCRPDGAVRCPCGRGRCERSSAARWTAAPPARQAGRAARRRRLRTRRGPGLAQKWSLLIRRHRDTGELAFYRCYSPEPVPLRSWGADRVTAWTSWRRWTLFALIAHALLAVISAHAGNRPARPRRPDRAGRKAGPTAAHRADHRTGPHPRLPAAVIVLAPPTPATTRAEGQNLQLP
jgi:hypothetical protein